MVTTQSFETFAINGDCSGFPNVAAVAMVVPGTGKSLSSSKHCWKRSHQGQGCPSSTMTTIAKIIDSQLVIPDEKKQVGDFSGFFFDW